jgi:hypothetical protein
MHWLDRRCPEKLRLTLVLQPMSASAGNNSKPLKRLAKLVRGGNLEALREAVTGLEEPHLVRAPLDSTGSTLLHRAALEGGWELVKSILPWALSGGSPPPIPPGAQTHLVQSPNLCLRAARIMPLQR